LLIVELLLDSPVAAFIDAGLGCIVELKEIGEFDLTTFCLKEFKNLRHPSFGIADLTRRTIPVNQFIAKHFDSLITT
jgi:hypothetical protein